MIRIPSTPSSGKVPFPKEPEKKGDRSSEFSLPKNPPLKSKGAPDSQIFNQAMQIILPHVKGERLLPLRVALGKMIHSSINAEGEVVMKKKTTEAKSKEDIEIDQAIDALADAVIEEMGDVRSALDPEDLRKARVRAQIHHDANKFRQRFKDGYQALLNELSKPQG